MPQYGRGSHRPNCEAACAAPGVDRRAARSRLAEQASYALSEAPPERGRSAVTNRGLMRDGVQPGRSAPERPGHAMRVLVVDDQKESLETLRHLLISFGHEVEVARDGAEALARLKLGMDLALVDAEIPGMDGFELSRRIRSDAEFHDLPVMTRRSCVSGRRCCSGSRRRPTA